MDPRDPLATGEVTRGSGLAAPAGGGPMLLTYAGVCAAQLMAVLTGASTVASILQVVAMPVLFTWLVTRPNPSRWLLGALFFSWLGDTLPRFVTGPPTAALVALAGPFLVAQLCYCKTFWPRRRRVFAQRPWLPVLYVAALIGFVVMSGSLFAIALPYGSCLTAMAILANGVGGRVAAGGALFFASDLMIGLGIVEVLDSESRLVTFAIMSTYWTAQFLLATGGHVAHGQRPVRVPAPGR